MQYPNSEICSNLSKITSWWNNQIRQALAKHEEVPISQIHFAPNEKNSLRLLNWRVWCLRYSVSLDFVLETILAYFHRSRRVQRGRVTTLGLAISVITGPKAREILQDSIAKRYPQRENRAMERSDLQNRILRLTTAKVDFSKGFLEGMAAYREKINVKRHNAANVAYRFSRPWRGNPWL